MEIIGDPLNGLQFLDRLSNCKVHPGNYSGITTDSQVAGQVLAAALAAFGPVVIGTAILARDPLKPGGQVAQLLYHLEKGRC